MTRGQVDFLDLLAMPIFAVAALFANGVIPGDVLGGTFDPTQSLFSLGPETQISYATVVAIAAIALVLWTNKPQLDVYGGIQAWVVIVTIGLILAPPFVPLISNWMAAEPWLGIVSFLLQTTGYTVVSFMG